MSTRKTIVGLAATGLLWAGISSASAAILELDTGWQSFEFAPAGSDWSESFEFTISDGAWFAVTDGFLSGDQFELFANGVSLGLTSAPTAEVVQIANDWDNAFADSRWSSAEVFLGAGSYLITGSTILTPFGGGLAAVQLSSSSLGGPSFEPPPGTTPVPTPATGILMISALFGLAASRRFVRGSSTQTS